MNGIPVLHAEGDCIARAWENSIVELYTNGCSMKTQYDKPEDPLSKDATMILTIHDPLSEPMIHKDFPGGPEDLQEYVMEVVEGIKDHLVRRPDDPEDTRWEYTYHQRLFRYDPPGYDPYNQIETMARKLADAPHTRRAQSITWKVWEDNDCYDPACLQSIWCRLVQGNDAWVLNTNIRFRSNDAYKAAFMNMHAFTELQREVASQLGVEPGEYMHIADSFHIYGSYFEDFEGFLKTVCDRSEDQRVYTTDFARDFFIEGCDALLAEDDMPPEKKAIIEKRRAQLKG
ncbi:MAG: hypothetical protein KAJ12_01790 [Bacteroidetes bacterium]|nr:hypothetical protein [Bacteroidota bacterium]